MDRDIARAVEQRALAALKPLEKELGVKITSKGGTIGATFFQLKIEFAQIGKGGVAETREAQSFKQMAKYYGLSPAMLHGTFRFRGEVYKLMGLKPKSPKWPILGQNVNSGRVFKFQPNQVKALWIGPLPDDMPTGTYIEPDDDDDIEARIAEIEGRD